MRPARAHILLGSVCLALIGVIAAIEVAADPALPASSMEGPSAIENASVVAASTETGLADLKSRPPFWQDRHVPAPVMIPAAIVPPAALPPPPPPPPPPSSELTLIGIVNGPEGRIAILRVKSSCKLERHVEGDAIDQWALTRILVDRVVFARGGSDAELLFPPPGERKPNQPGSSTTPHMPVPVPPVTPRR